MTTISYEWTGSDGETKIFKTYPEVLEWKQEHGGSYRQLENFEPSQDTEHCIKGAAKVTRWKNYKF
jgi:hypothetical protein